MKKIEREKSEILVALLLFCFNNKAGINVEYRRECFPQYPISDFNSYPEDIIIY